MTQSFDTELIQGLECHVGRHRVLVPAEFVGSVVELEVSQPPPLAKRWLSGIGLHDGASVACVTFGAVDEAKVASRRSVTGVLLAVDSPLKLLLEVSRVRSFQRVRRTETRAAQPSNTPAWVAPATDESGQVCSLIDVTAMVKDLVGT